MVNTVFVTFFSLFALLFGGPVAALKVGATMAAALCVVDVAANLVSQLYSFFSKL